ncbi:HDOD domain-containing protein [Agaribacter flavus]|uniref:HDOD domain-containing protein n=1 Tax=Agaribacter flavus TaxID=1902781 RepID=A0ABV7FMU0_9ALTE
MNAIEYAQKASKLFAVPQTAIDIKKMSDSGTANMEDIAKVIANDPGLAAHVLKLANSAVYRFSRKIENLDKAIQIIGVNSVYEFALAFAVSDSLSLEHKKYINVRQYWFQSLCCAFLAKKIAIVCKEKDVSRLFMAGLFHNIGELAVLRINPHLAKDCQGFSEMKVPKLHQMELLGFSYAEISASLLQRWLLPDSIVSAVAMQHHDDIPALQEEVQIIQLAYILSLVASYPDKYRLNLVMPEFLHSTLNLNLNQVTDLLEDARHQTEEAVSLFVE